MVYLIMIGVGGGLVFLVIIGILCRCLCCSGPCCSCCRRKRLAASELDHYVPLTADDPDATPKTNEKRRQLEVRFLASPPLFPVSHTLTRDHQI
jgi:hypothetical protein